MNTKYKKITKITIMVQNKLFLRNFLMKFIITTSQKLLDFKKEKQFN
jgi:hypothetical protein